MQIKFDTQDRLIDGVNYRVTPLTGRHGLKVLSKLTSIVRPVISEGGTEEVAILAIVMELVGRIHEPELMAIVEDMATKTLFDAEGGEKWQVLSKEFDQFFAANYGQLAKWLTFALEANFGDLMEALRDLTGAAAQESA